MPTPRSLLAFTASALTLLAPALPAQEQTDSIELDPALGALDVDPSTKRLTIRFPVAMDTSAGYSICGGGPSFPTIEQIAWDDDRTLVLDVGLEADRRYSMPLNCSGSGLNFRRADGSAWPATDWSFWTAQIEEVSESQQAANDQATTKLLDLLQTQYSYRDRVVDDWAPIIESVRSRLLRSRDATSFAMRAAEALSVGRDSHLWMRVDGQIVPTFQRSFVPNFDGRAVGRIVPDLEQLSAVAYRGTIGTGEERLDYLLISSWQRQAEEAILVGVEALKEMTASGRDLILDVRPNGGGDERLAGRVARQFLSEAVVYAHQAVRNDETGEFDDIHSRTLYGAPDEERFQNRVCVLMGPQCVSSNEAFLLMMRQAEKATLIGGQSGGASGNPQPFDLGNGVEALLPSWRALDGDKNSIEGVGIVPDLEVEFDSSDSNGRSDPVLERAIEFLRDR
ncbi:MAG: S41 family peptidase [Planctomycetota bacterium]